MHGLVNRTLQCFCNDTYGVAVWGSVVAEAATEHSSFEAMLTYPDAETELLLAALMRQQGISRADLLEDIGTYLVSHENMGSVRRLLRFTGSSFIDFLRSLDDLKGRVHLALPDLEFPDLSLREHAPGRCSLYCQGPPAQFGRVLVGVLRAMADDYGALVCIDYFAPEAGLEMISVDVVESAFSDGRDFTLSLREGGAHAG